MKEQTEAQLKRQMIGEHLKALRNVLIISVVAIVVCFLIIFYFFREPLVIFLLKPITSPSIHVVATQVAEALISQLKASLIAGVVVAMPVIMWQIWSFISPALYKEEKKLYITLFFFAVILFVVGVVFSYVFVFPLAINLFFEAREGIVTSMWSIEQYFNFTLSFVLPFGLMFELPVVIAMVAKRGWVTYQQMSKNRKYVLFAIAVIAGILTPPDVVSQIMLGLPMVALYEISVQIARFIKVKKPAEAIE